MHTFFAFLKTAVVIVSLFLIFLEMHRKFMNSKLDYKLVLDYIYVFLSNY